MTDQSDSATSHQILCGFCRAPVGLRVEGEPDSEAGCAACDNWAAKDEVIRIAGEYAKDEAQMILNRKMQDVARHSKIMKFTGKTVSDKTYRFVIDLQI